MADSLTKPAAGEPSPTDDAAAGEPAPTASESSTERELFAGMSWFENAKDEPVDLAKLLREGAEPKLPRSALVVQAVARRMQEPLRAAADPDPKIGLKAVRVLRQLLDQLEEAHVAHARGWLWRWGDIAQMLGVSRQAIQQRYGKGKKRVRARNRARRYMAEVTIAGWRAANRGQPARHPLADDQPTDDHSTAG